MPGRFAIEGSLQQRFAMKFASAAFVALLVGSVCVAVADGIADDEIFDQQLGHLATAMAVTMGRADALAEAGNLPSNFELISVRPQPQDGLRYQVWLADGTLLRHSEGTSMTTPLASLEQTGFTTVELQGKAYRVYAAPSPDGASIFQVAEPIDNRNRIHLALLLTYLTALVLPLLLTWQVSGVLLRRSLQFFNTLAERVAKRDPQDARPLQMEAPPQEIVPMLNSVNGLVQRAASVISLEQRFTSVAAHELRAPLAGIRAQAQVARSAETQQELQESLALVIRGVDHAARVFDQLLDLTRMEGLASERATQFKPVDLQAVCHQVLAELQFSMRRKHIHLVDSTQPQGFEGVHFAAYLIVRNLVANAMLYTPEHGTVAVGIVVQDTQLLLQVDDSGPGIAPQDRQRVFERYSRLQPSCTEGIGLGLFIVQQAVHLHQGQITLLDSPFGGLRAQVSLPLHLSLAVAD
jgi:signal transduction histidine kinase